MNGREWEERLLAEWDAASSRDPITRMRQQPQRQDSLDEQLRDLARAATKLGCYDAADWIATAINRGVRT